MKTTQRRNLVKTPQAGQHMTHTGSSVSGETRMSRARMWVVAALALSGPLLCVTSSSATWTFCESQANAALQPGDREAPANKARLVDLRPKFKKGQELRYVMTLTSENATELPSFVQKQTSRQEVEFRLVTDAVNAEGVATVRLIYDAIAIEIDAGDQTISFDSRSAKKAVPTTPRNRGTGTKRDNDKSKPGGAKPKPTDGVDPDAIDVPDLDALDAAGDASAMIEQAIRPMIGAALTLTVAPDGTIRQVTGGEAIASALVGQFAGPIADPQGVKDLFGPVFSLRNAKGEASIGETWRYEDRIDLAMLGALKLTTDHTLKSAAGSRANVEFSGAIELASEVPGGSPQTFKLTDTRYEGAYVWNTDAGSLERLEQTQAFTLEGQAQGASLKIRNDGKVRVARKKD